MVLVHGIHDCVFKVHQTKMIVVRFEIMSVEQNKYSRCDEFRRKEGNVTHPLQTNTMSKCFLYSVQRGHALCLSPNIHCRMLMCLDL